MVRFVAKWLGQYGAEKVVIQPPFAGATCSRVCALGETPARSRPSTAQSTPPTTPAIPMPSETSETSAWERAVSAASGLHLGAHSSFSVSYFFLALRPK